MKRLFNRLFVVGALGTIGLLSSCDNNDEILITDPNAEFDVVLDMTEGEGDVDASVFVDANTQASILAKITFTSTSASMKRLYITQNIAGAGAVPYELPGNVDNKADGSLDIPAANSNNIEYQIELPVPSGVSTGSVVYELWTTTGRGDYRDQTKRIAVGVGTITLQYGGQNPVADVKSFSAKILAAPRNDLASESFISLLDGNLYKISQGAEYAAFWDFGYFYGSSAKKASLASTSAYEVAFGSTGGVPFIDVDAIAGTTELNNAYFKKSTEFSEANFDAIAISGDLSNVTKSSDQFVNNLAVGDVIEFVDQYNKKGLIKVTELYLGNSGNGYDSDAYIKIDVKVQP